MTGISLAREIHIEVSEEDIFKNDILGFQESVRKLAQLVSRNETPFTLGICGRWGSGKTSFMALLQKFVEKEYSKKTFWFNAWEYENESSLLLPFLSKLSKEFPLEGDVWKKTKKIASVLTYVGASAFLKATTNKMVSLGDVTKAFDYVEKQSEIYDEWIGETQKLKDTFQEIIDKIGDGGLIIFIDDLDRCLPDTVVKMIENIKHFLSVKNCTFIIGVDDYVLNNIISNKYKSVIDGAEYLEKIINFSFHIPSKEKTNLKKYVINYVDTITKDGFFADNESLVLDFIRIIECIDYVNPRKLKQLLIRYTIYLTLDDHNSYLNELVIKLLLYRHIMPDVYNYKKDKGYVEFSPITLNHKLGPDEVAKNSCMGFSELLFNPKYSEISSYSDQILCCIGYFNKPNDPAAIQKDQFARPESKQYVLEHVSKGGYLSHKKYFDLIDFLFSFS